MNSRLVGRVPLGRGAFAVALQRGVSQTLTPPPDSVGEAASEPYAFLQTAVQG